jgi:hypothetical protein
VKTVKAQSNGSLLDLNQILERLVEKRPIFHSEADFQHALAWEIHHANPDASIRLELPVRTDDGRVHIDLLVVCDHQHFAIELKYKTALLNVRRGDIAPKFYPVLSSPKPLDFPCWAVGATGAGAEPLA